MESLYATSTSADSLCCVGIDLGTTNTTVAVWDEETKQPRCLRLSLALKSDLGKYLKSFPSAVSFLEDGGFSVGAAAFRSDSYSDSDLNSERPSSTHPSTPLTSSKRIFGVLYSTLSEETKKSLPFDVISDDDEGYCNVNLGRSGLNEIVTPERIATILLSAIRSSASTTLYGTSDASITSCVIGVPSHFSLRSRSLLESAGLAAGFNKVTTFAESSAAAISYGLFVRSDAKPTTALVFDMGGGTTDVTICRCEGGTDAKFMLLKSFGDDCLGGDDVDSILVDWVKKNSRVKENFQWDDKEIRDICRNAKVELCGNAEEQLEELEEVTIDIDIDIDIEKQKLLLTRENFDVLIENILSRCERLIDRGLEKMKVEDIDEVILVGGSSRIGAVRRLLLRKFPHLEGLCSAVDPDEAVALGLSVRGGLISGAAKPFEVRSSLMLDLLPHPVGIIVDGQFVTVMERNSQLPCRGSVKFTTETVNQQGVEVSVAEDVGDFGGTVRELKKFKFMLYKLTDEEEEYYRESKQERIVEITLVADDEGRVRCHLFDNFDPEHVRPDDKTMPSDQKRLIVVSVFLFVVYFVLRMVNAKLEKREIDEDNGEGDEMNSVNNNIADVEF